MLGRSDSGGRPRRPPHRLTLTFRPGKALHAMSNTQEWLRRGQEVLIGNYARLPVVMTRGEGSYLFDADGRRYLDLFPGFGGAVLGHAHLALVEAVTRQAQKLWHTGNTFYTEPQIEVAERLARHAFKGQAFFCHSGLEANE